MVQLLINIIIAAVAAWLIDYILTLIGFPAPFPMIAAILVFLAIAFGGRTYLSRYF